MTVIDADAHVHECDRTWDFFEESDREFKPLILAQHDGPEPRRTHWVIDGRVGGRPEGNVGAATPREYRELEDVEGRLRHMDELGIDIQVLYPSILTALTDRPEVEGALWRAYNRWMADAYQKGRGRLRWVCRAPLTSMDAACAELRFAKSHGACGVFLRSIEGERFICDPFFFPLYEEASALDMPICVHVSMGNRRVFEFLSQPPDGGAFMKFKLSGVAACHTIVMNGIPEKFPELRWAFVEASAEWVPYVVRELQKRFAHRGRSLTPHVLRDSRIFVTCQVDDDLPHVLQYAGEDNLVIGTDYGHADTATELHAMKELQAREDVDQRVIHKILDDNARALYGL
jgi:predicted TIM-barrel fold metal-dependent hydrolase